MWTTSRASLPVECLPTGTPRPSSSTVTMPSALIVTLIVVAWPAIASSIELSTTSQTRWCRPRASVEPMYMPGRLRTASRPSRTWMLAARVVASARLRAARRACRVGRWSAAFGSARRASVAGLGIGCRLRSRGSSGQALVEPPEFFVAVVLDHDPAAAPRSGEADLGAQRATQVFLDAFEVRVRRAGRCRPAGCGFGSRRRRTSSSVWRTESSWPMTESRTRSWSSGARPPSARPWPSVSRPSATAAWTPGARSRRRSVLATVERARPTRVATSSWLNPNSSMSWR